MNPKQEASKSGSASAAARMPKPGELYTGVFQSASTRGGFVIPQTPGISDIFIPNESLGAALHGDEVRVRILRLRPGRASEGEIERVLKHANKRIVGKFRRAGKVCIVTPKNQKLRKSVEIRRRFTEEEIPEGAWVIVDVETWAESPSAPLAGRITEVLGTEENRRLPILLLIREGGIQPEFPAEVEAEAEEIKKGRISEKEAARRRDFRNDRVMTIDPATAKDFDDAISLVERKRDGWRVAVHIADVAHYVTHGSKIDLEAYDRATSIYPVDRVIPMLPETLSNDLCSLRPGEDRLTTTAVFDVSREGKVSGIELCESMIHSARRFTYDEVQGLMDRADGIEHSKHPQPEIPSALLDDLLELRKASAALFAARMKRGALDLDMPETQILFDGRGIVAGLARKERIEAYRLIEDLMLSANEAVARELTRHEIPFLYRIHEPPSEDKLLALAPVLGRFGIQLPRKGHIPQSVLQQAIRKAQMNPAGVIVQRLVLRSLMRAQYQPGNTGHYGLASECYTHFTSPIRRYPDLIVHRAVKSLLGSRDDRDAYIRYSSDLLPEWGRHTSSREERAQRIEWDAQKILTLEFMKRFIGDVFDGHISGLLGRGFFVEFVDYPAEGFVPIQTLEDDYYDFDSETMAFYGRRGNRAYALGDPVKAQIERIDVLAGEMDLRLVRKESKGESGKPPKSRGKAKGNKNNWRKQMRRRIGKRR